MRTVRYAPATTNPTRIPTSRARCPIVGFRLVTAHASDHRVPARSADARTVGLLADPGTAAELARRLEGDLPELLGRHLGGSWRVESVEEELELDAVATGGVGSEGSDRSPPLAIANPVGIAATTRAAARHERRTTALPQPSPGGRGQAVCRRCRLRSRTQVGPDPVLEVTHRLLPARLATRRGPGGPKPDASLSYSRHRRDGGVLHVHVEPQHHRRPQRLGQPRQACTAPRRTRRIDRSVPDLLHRRLATTASATRRYAR